MATKAIRRKANTSTRRVNTALVLNPNRGLTVGRGSVRKSASRRSNPTRRKVAVAARVMNNPKRRRRHARRRNPSSTFGQLTAAALTALGFTGLDIIAGRVLPASQSLWARVIGKVGLGLAVQHFGGSIPLVGKHKNEIALVFFVLGLSDLVRAFVVPPVNQVINQYTGLSLLPPAPAPAAAASDGTTQGIVYGGRRFYPGTAYA